MICIYGIRLIVNNIYHSYEILEKPAGQVNLMVEEFVSRCELPIYLPHEMECITDAHGLALSLLNIKSSKQNAHCVLIVPPEQKHCNHHAW